MIQSGTLSPESRVIPEHALTVEEAKQFSDPESAPLPKPAKSADEKHRLGWGPFLIGLAALILWSLYRFASNVVDTFK